MKLEVKAIPVPASSAHPPPPADALPKHEFSIGIIAPKGSGKTTVIANLLSFYRNYFHTIIVFSPTVASDEKWDWYCFLTNWLGKETKTISRKQRIKTMGP